jgi:putative hydrolase of the HAD superfamily
VQSTLRAIAFDLDDTLWEVGPVIARAERRLLEWLRQHYPRIPERFTADDMRAARMQLARERPELAHDVTHLRLTTLASHARDCGYEEAIAEAAFEVFFAARNEVELYRDVQPALARLRSRFRLATLSNGNADLARIGLHEHFAVSLSARDVGAGKPDPRGFLAVAVRLGVEPGEIAYVGDDPRIDVAGARAAGLRTVWINRAKRPWPMDVRAADLEVHDIEQLAQALGV